MAQFNMRAMSLRGDNMRQLELADMFIDNIEDQGVGECKAVICVMNQGKTNQYGKAEFAATLRNRDVFRCPQGKMGFYFLHRFDLSEEGLPNFESPETWFNIKMYRGKEPSEKMTEVKYNVHLRAVKNCYEACGFELNKSTHFMRGDSVRYAEAKGLGRDSRCGMGRWEQGSMDECYARTLPIDGMRTMAGFHPEHRNYRILRNIDVPEELLDQVFPGVEHIFDAEKAKPEKERNIAKIQFLELLLYFRKVILQDSCRLKIRFPNHHLWNHPVFKDPSYSDFQMQVLEASEQEVVQTPTLEERLPAVMEGFNLKITELMQSHETMKSDTRKSVQEIKNIIKSTKIQINFTDPENDENPMVGGNENNSSASTRSTTTFFNGVTQSTQQRFIPNRMQLAIQADERPTKRMRYRQNVDVDPPLHYKMNRDITTISELWKEWYIGSNTIPPVTSLEQQFGPKWRREEADRVWFSKRKQVIRLVHDIAKKNDTSLNETIRSLDNYMKRYKKQMNWLAQNKNAVLNALSD